MGEAKRRKNSDGTYKYYKGDGYKQAQRFRLRDLWKYWKFGNRKKRKK